MDSLTAPPQNQASGQYGTAIGTTSALNQMGMGDIANDPRLQEYLEDLPQFGMGYRQQFGDIQSGGRQALSQMYANQRNMGGGFAGAGAGAQAFGQGYSGLMGEQARQRRGVVEANNTTTNVNPPPTSAALYDGHTITQGGIKWQWNGSNWENMGAG